MRLGRALARAFRLRAACSPLHWPSRSAAPRSSILLIRATVSRTPCKYVCGRAAVAAGKTTALMDECRRAGARAGQPPRADGTTSSRRSAGRLSLSMSAIAVCPESRAPDGPPPASYFRLRNCYSRRRLMDGGARRDDGARAATASALGEPGPGRAKWRTALVSLANSPVRE